MRIQLRKPNEGKIKVLAETLDDLWELEHIIESGDQVRGRTERKINLGGDKSNQVRKAMTLTIKVEKVELENEVLRIHGVITEGPEDLISFGDHHTINVSNGTEVEIIKEWDSLSLEKLEQAEKTKPLNTLVVIFDREQAILAELTRRGYEVVTTLSGNVAKKAEGGGTENFWKTIADTVNDFDNRKNYSLVVCASPAFWTDYLVNELKGDLKKKTIATSCGSVSEGAISEIVKRPEVQKALESDRTTQEESLVAEVLEAIAGDKACYGFDECAEKVSLGQVKLIVVTNTLINHAREENWYERLDEVLSQAKSTQATVRIIEHSTDKIDALGGIAGVLRW